MTLTEQHNAALYILKSRQRIKRFVKDCELFPDELEALINRLLEVQDLEVQKAAKAEAKKEQTRQVANQILNDSGVSKDELINYLQTL